MENMPKSPMPTPIDVFPFISSSTKIIKNTMRKIATGININVNLKSRRWLFA
jgi:hypothetical protein